MNYVNVKSRITEIVVTSNGKPQPNAENATKRFQPVLPSARMDLSKYKSYSFILIHLIFFKASVMN